MPKLTYKDMTLAVGMFGGDVTITLRSLQVKMPIADLAALIYPQFDAQEKSEVEGLSKV